MVGDARVARARLKTGAGTSRDPSGHLSGAYRALLDPNLIHSSHALRCALSGRRSSSERSLPELDLHLRSSPHTLDRARRAVAGTLHEVDTHSSKLGRGRGSERSRAVTERLTCTTRSRSKAPASSASRTSTRHRPLELLRRLLDLAPGGLAVSMSPPLGGDRRPEEFDLIVCYVTDWSVILGDCVQTLGCAVGEQRTNSTAPVPMVEFSPCRPPRTKNAQLRHF
jgi:hypothetical protein